MAASDDEPDGQFRIGWASADLTPEKPVVLTGFSRARVSEGVADPITATVLAFESVRADGSPAMVIMVSCDLISISDELRDRVRAKVSQSLPEIAAEKIVLNGTHTHAGPEIGVASTKAFTTQLTALFLLTILIGQQRNTLDIEQSKTLAGSFSRDRKSVV